MLGIGYKTPAVIAIDDLARADKALVAHLVHPYARYGFAVACLKSGSPGGVGDVNRLRHALIEALEEGLNHFRMETLDKAAAEQQYAAISETRLSDDAGLVQGNLAKVGKFLFPTVMTTDKGAAETFGSVKSIAELLRSGASLDLPYDFKRSFAPSVSKINNGKASQKVPRGTLLEAACCAVTTVTPLKPAAWIGQRNTAIVPDLPKIAEIVDFIAIFREMRAHQGADKALLKSVTTERRAPAASNRLTVAKSTSKQPANEYRRPPIFRGNYPYAPTDADYFGPPGVLAAIGYWSLEADKSSWGASVLEALTGKPIYIVSYDNISHQQFSHHAINLAKSGLLYGLIKELTFDTLVGGAEIEGGRPDRRSTNRQLFKLMASRFLQQFNQPTFQDFFAFRAIYPSGLEPLFEEYFMDSHLDNSELKLIVEGASAYGAWLNRSAYFVAKEEGGKDRDKVRKHKAKITTVLESAAMSAKSGEALIAHVSTQAGRLAQTDAPSEAKRFIDAVIGEEISLVRARQMLMAYLRLQPKFVPRIEPTDNEVNDTEIDIEQSEASGD